MPVLREIVFCVLGRQLCGEGQLLVKQLGMTLLGSLLAIVEKTLLLLLLMK